MRSIRDARTRTDIVLCWALLEAPHLVEPSASMNLVVVPTLSKLKGVHR
jgi:hypothetical protein